MKAVVISRAGGPEVLEVQEVEDPTATVGDDQVLIRVEATGVNRADTLQRKGFHPPPPGASPYPGLECSGTVESVGKLVHRWKVGDQVAAAIFFILLVDTLFFFFFFFFLCELIEILTDYPSSSD